MQLTSDQTSRDKLAFLVVTFVNQVHPFYDIINKWIAIHSRYPYQCGSTVNIFKIVIEENGIFLVPWFNSVNWLKVTTFQLSVFLGTP